MERLDAISYTFVSLHRGKQGNDSDRFWFSRWIHTLFFLKWTKDTLHNRVRNDVPVASLPRVSRAFMHVVRFTLKYAVICAFRHASLAHTCLSPALLRGARTHACVSRTPPQWIRCEVTFFSPHVFRVSMCFYCDCMCVSRSSIRCKVTYLSSCLSLLAYVF